MNSRAVGAAASLEVSRCTDATPKPNGVIRILHPVWRLAPGGLERQLVSVVNLLPPERFSHVVYVAGWNDESEQLAAELRPGVEIIRDDERGNAALPRRMAAAARSRGVDLIHVRGLSLLPDAVLAAEWLGDVPVVFSFHGFEHSTPEISGIRRKVLRESALRAVDRWAVGRTAVAAIAEVLNLPADSFGVVPNGVDLDWFEPAPANRTALRRTLGVPEDRHLFVTCGNIKPVKGHAILLDAIARFDATVRQRSTWIIAGRDYMDGQLHLQASRIARADIRFLGEVPDVRPWLQAADAFVLPSLSEGFSNALLEAMACGCAIIATSTGGNLDAIETPSCGLLVEPGNAAELASGMEQLAQDATARAGFAREARARAAAFSREAMLLAYADRYAAAAMRASIDEETHTVSPATACPIGAPA